MADTAGFVYQTAGLMHYTITPTMIPPSLPFQLNTSSFKDIVPQVTKIVLRISCLHHIPIATLNEAGL